MKRIGVITTGGDAPGMNTAIRAVVRIALGVGMEVFGIRRGYRGLFENDLFRMNSRSVSGIINMGGTILKSIRSPEFKERRVREKAHENLKENRIEGLVTIGGDGTARGAFCLFSEFNFPVVLIPASIDNDVYGTDYTVGFDTAVNTAVDAIDRIRDTATSHERIFIIEVMGREKGNLALEVAVACGAEIVLIPELKIDWDKICVEIKEQERKGKVSSMVVLAEGAGKAQDVVKVLKEKFPEREIRFSVLGYIQRGGKPTAFTRTLATKFGMEAVRMLQDELYGYMVGLKDGKIVHIPLKQVASQRKPPPLEYLEIVKLMAI
ncbi:MAG TPA: 6-phosphofructokinase [Candidatus Omnitrophica bacterium]|nr:6-phosphofructokinase [Candidatus Omnitrophota bacterium]